MIFYSQKLDHTEEIEKLMIDWTVTDRKKVLVVENIKEKRTKKINNILGKEKRKSLKKRFRLASLIVSISKKKEENNKLQTL